MLLTALLFGLATASALLLGSLLGAFWQPPKGLVAAALAFASGSLISALAFDLFGDAFAHAGGWFAGPGFLAGAAVFITVDSLLERYTTGAGTSGFGLLAGVTLDGVPENIALGIVLLGGEGGAGGIALLAAILASNLPEALGGTRQMREQGRSKGFAIGVWGGTGLVLAAAVVLGNTVFAGLGDKPRAVLLAFAGGAVLASLADTVMPRAYEDGGPFVAFATAAGFLVSFLLSE